MSPTDTPQSVSNPSSQTGMRTLRRNNNQNDSPPQRVDGRTLKKATRGPRKMVADMVDERLKIGEKIGSLLWLIWMILTVIGFIGSFITFGITGLMVLPVLNLLLVSPKLVYKITILILDFVGVGEVLTVINKIGLDKVKIVVAGWQKATIIALDAVVITIYALVISLMISTTCSILGGLCS
ncbi:MAG TPA: hypothetical protein VJJ24_03255 [Candidatus Paceibacterota bacterium]